MSTITLPFQHEGQDVLIVDVKLPKDSLIDEIHNRATLVFQRDQRVKTIIVSFNLQTAFFFDVYSRRLDQANLRSHPFDSMIISHAENSHIAKLVAKMLPISKYIKAGYGLIFDKSGIQNRPIEIWLYDDWNFDNPARDENVKKGQNPVHFVPGLPLLRDNGSAHQVMADKRYLKSEACHDRIRQIMHLDQTFEESAK